MCVRVSFWLMNNLSEENFMAKCKVSLSTVPCVNVNSTVHDFESIEQAVLFAKNCSAPDSVNVVLDLLDEDGEFVQRLYHYDCKSDEHQEYPIEEATIELLEEAKVVNEISKESEPVVLEPSKLSDLSEAEIEGLRDSVQREKESLEGAELVAVVGVPAGIDSDSRLESDPVVEESEPSEV